MAATAILYGKTPSKIFFPGTGGQISTKLDMYCFGKNTRIELENCNVFINHYLVMTLTLLKARSTLVAFALNKENC